MQLRARPISNRRSATEGAHPDGNDQEDEENIEENLSNPGRGSRDSTESEDRCDDRNDEKEDNPTEHDVWQGLRFRFPTDESLSRQSRAIENRIFTTHS